MLNPKKTKSMIASRFRTNALGYGDQTLSDAELKEVNNLRIFWVTLGCKLAFEPHLREVVSKAAKSLNCAEQESYLIVYVWSRTVSIHMSCPARSIVPSCRCRLPNLIWVCWRVLFAVRKYSVRVNFVIWDTERRSGPCVCSIIFIIDRTFLCMSICIIVLQIALEELQLLWLSLL